MKFASSLLLLATPLTALAHPGHAPADHSHAWMWLAAAGASVAVATFAFIRVGRRPAVTQVSASAAPSMNLASVSAHCDGPCGIYDPATARITGEAVRSMTNKILGLAQPDPSDAVAVARYHNTLSRYVAIKEEQAELTKHELLVLWTDYFKPAHLEAHPELHTIFWEAAKLCSACKIEVSSVHADELMEAIEAIHNLFWKTKGRDVKWVLAAG